MADAQLKTIRSDDRLACEGDRLLISHFSSFQADQSWRQTHHWDGQDSWIGEVQTNKKGESKKVYRYVSLEELIEHIQASLRGLVIRTKAVSASTLVDGRLDVFTAGKSNFLLGLQRNFAGGPLADGHVICIVFTQRRQVPKQLNWKWFRYRTVRYETVVFEFVTPNDQTTTRFNEALFGQEIGGLAFVFSRSPKLEKV